MGKRNRERRAAKARKRRASAYGRGSASRSGPGHRHDPDTVTIALLAAARSPAAGTAAGVDDAHALLASFPQASVEQVAEALLLRLVGLLWRSGWTPLDLSEVVRRRLSGDETHLLSGVLAEESSAYPASSIHPQWREQLVALGAQRWWRAGVALLHAVSARHGYPRVEVVASAIALIGALEQLPELQQVLPPPGQAHVAAGSARTAGADQKVLARVRALLAKAESTQFPEEAEALSAKAQELMTRHSLERLVVESAAGEHDPMTVRRIWLERPYPGAKATLVHVVAEANRCRAVWSEGLGFVTVIGAELDVGAVELLSTSLLVQATRAMVASGQDVDAYGRSRTRSFRQSFLLSYADRIGERLRGASQTATEELTRDDSNAGNLLPVLAAQVERLDEACHELFGQTVERRVSVSNGAGWAAGRAAADLAVLDVTPRIAEAG